MQIDLNHIINTDAASGLKALPDNCVQCTVTSPPYFGLRDYGTAKWEGGDPNCKHFRQAKNNNPDWNIQSRHSVEHGIGDAIFNECCGYCGAVRIDAQIGLERTPETYIERLVELFAEVRRVTRKDGVLWLNIGDSYAGSGRGKNDRKTNNKGNVGIKKPLPAVRSGLKPKDLIGIPWMLAFALRNSGWYLRQDCIWSKPNAMPESVTDRCTKSHEYIFLFNKSPRYYFNSKAIAVQVKDATALKFINGQHKRIPRPCIDSHGGNQGSTSGIPSIRKGAGIDNRAAINGYGIKGHKGYFDKEGNLIGDGFANKRSVWNVATNPLKDAHFATFPQALIIECVKSGSRPGDLILDPFMGSGTTAIVANKLERNYIGFELNEKYCRIAEKRIHKELGLFKNVRYAGLQ